MMFSFVIIVVCSLAILPLVGLALGLGKKKPKLAKASASLLIFELMLVILIIMLISAQAYVPQDLRNAHIWFPLVICTGVFLSLMLIVWRPFKPKARRIAVMSLVAVMVATIAAVVGIDNYRKGFIEVGDGDSEIDLMQYLPFPDKSREPTSLVKTLDLPSTLSFSDNMPILDGATALYPLYSAFARATYPEDYYYPNVAPSSNLKDPEYWSEPNYVLCSKSGAAFQNLVDGYVDIAFLSEISSAQADLASEKGVVIQSAPIGKEAFVFMVNSRNKLDGLTQEDINGIYTGRIKNWSKVGGANDRIDAYQRPQDSGSQTALQRFVKGPIMEPKSEQVYSMMMGMYNAIAKYKNYRNAIGFSFRFYIESMLNDAELKQVKLLDIDGVSPAKENIASGAYPYSGQFYAVTASSRVPANDAERARMENAKRLIDWILAEQGQELVEKTGYVPIG
jgi:phosphate transport system substrate-binding protein